MEPPALAPPPEPGPAVPVKVRPEDFHRVAREFVDGQNRVMDAYHSLNTTLRGLTGAAGDDEMAQTFARDYPHAVREIFTGFVRLHELLGAIGQGLAASGENHRRADADAAGEHGDGFPPLMPDQCPAVAEPAPIIGEGDATLLASLAEFLNPYPSGHVEKLDDTARAFTTAGEAVTTIAGDLKASLMSLTGNNTSEDLDALDAFWRRVDGGEATLFGALAESCTTVGQACSHYATAVLDTRNEINGILGELALELAATGIVIAAAELFTGGGATPVVGPAGAAVLRSASGRLAVLVGNAAAALATAGAVTAVSHTAGALSMATSHTPRPNIAQTEATNTGKSLSTGETTFPSLKTNRKQLEKKFKHAIDFGVQESRGSDGFKNFEESIRKFINNPSTEVKTGTYHGEPAILHFDRHTGLAVVQRPNGEFWSGWRLSDVQIENVINRGKLGGSK